MPENPHITFYDIKLIDNKIEFCQRHEQPESAS